MHIKSIPSYLYLIIGLLLILSTFVQAQNIIELDSPDPSVADYGEVLTTYFTRSISQGKMVDNETKVILGPGEYQINSTIRLTLGDQLYLDFGAKLIRTKCRSKAPMIHLDGRYSSVIGSAMNIIESQCPGLTSGLIRVGQGDTSANRNIISCRVEHLTITGSHQSYPNNQSTGIYIYNNQNEPSGGANSTSYFHTISDVNFSYLHKGLHLYNSNACTIDRILLNRVGASGGQGVLLEGAQETKIANVHHGQSPGAESLTFKSSARSYLPAYNTIFNYVIEIGKITNSRTSNVGYCLNFDVPSDEFIDNEVNIVCNHNYLAKTRKGVSFKQFKEKAPKSIIRE